jgi:hypothetical protein
MKFNLVLAAVLAIGTAGVAFAQQPPAPPAGGPPGGGRGGALAAACTTEIAASCAGQAGRGVRQCLTENEAKLGAGCKAALAAAPAGRGPAPAGQ